MYLLYAKFSLQQGARTLVSNLQTPSRILVGCDKGATWSLEVQDYKNTSQSRLEIN